MPLDVYKPVRDPQAISIMVPSRGRPHYLERLYESLEATTRDKHRVDVWVYVDEDDEATCRFLGAEQRHARSVAVHHHVGPRCVTQGETYNTLRQECTTEPGIYMFAGDKILFEADGWDESVREAFNQYSDRVLFAYPVDPHHGPDFGAYGFVSAEWCNLLGRLFTEHFPFWFDDEWIDQVATMIQRKQRLDVRLAFQSQVPGHKGPTQRMRNLFFWRKFFINLADERVADAEILRRFIHPVGSPAYNVSRACGLAAGAKFTEHWRRRPAEEILYDERVYETDSSKRPLHPPPLYLAAERRAVRRLRRLVGPRWQAGRYKDALHVIDNILFSSQYLETVQHARIVWTCRLRWAWRQWPRVWRALPHVERYPEFLMRIVRFIRLCLSGQSGL